MTREEAIETLNVYNDCFLKGKIPKGITKMTVDNKELSSALDMVIKALEREPKRGHWIATRDYFAYSSIDYVECSCCGHESLEEGHFCPFCGAMMDGGECKY